MAVVPFSKAPPSMGGPAPSETNLLMALADMHSKGRLKPHGGTNDPTPAPPKLESGS